MKTGVVFIISLVVLVTILSCIFPSYLATILQPTSDEPEAEASGSAGIDQARSLAMPTETASTPTSTITSTLENVQPEAAVKTTQPAGHPHAMSQVEEYTRLVGSTEGELVEEGYAEVAVEIPKSALEVQLALIAADVGKPIDLVAAPDHSGRLFPVDQRGVIHLIGKGGELRGEPFLDLRKRLSAIGAKTGSPGVMAVIFDPEYGDNGRFYVYYRFPYREEAYAAWRFIDRISEFSISSDDPDLADPRSERILLEVEPQSGWDFAARLVFLTERTLALNVWQTGAKPRVSTTCLDLKNPGVALPTCSGDLPGNELSREPELTPITTRRGVEKLAITANTSAYLYQGQIFPSLNARFIFAGVKGGDIQQGSRLFSAARLDLERQEWEVEELVLSVGESGWLNEFISGIGQDAAGELYLLTSQKEGGEGTGKIYKITPRVHKERSTVENPKEYLPLTDNYARVVRKAPVYRNLADVRNNDPFGTHGGGGNYWVSLRESATVGGRTYYRISYGWGVYAWIAASNLSFNVPLSHLRGVDLREGSGKPLAMAYQPVNIRSLPGDMRDETIISTLQPYDLVTIYEMQEVDGATWYRIGPDQWTHSNYLRVILPGSRPEGVEVDEKWVEVNLAQQVVIAHEGDTPVFATLTATGRRGFATEKGLYRVWAILREAPMQWLDSTNPYSLAHVPWIMYFNQGQGLHGTYWHDLFGTVRSAGCVNLSPHDAKWFFDWAGPELPEGQRILYPKGENPGVWVWVHDNRPDLQAEIDQ
jgi:hypothetical protein